MFSGSPSFILTLTCLTKDAENVSKMLKPRLEKVPAAPITSEKHKYSHWAAGFSHNPHFVFCILFRTRTTLEQNSQIQNSSTNFESRNSGTRQLISSQMKLIQPLSSKNLISTFSPSYSGTPLPIGINDHSIKVQMKCFFLFPNLKEQQKSGRSPFTIS